MIYDISKREFPFVDLKIHKPMMLQGSNIMKLTIKKELNIPVNIQLPECNIQIAKNQKQCDLVFTGEEISLLEWVEQIEERVKQLLFENRQWFETDLEESDIDQFFLPLLKWNRTQKHYIWKGVQLPHDVNMFDERGEKINSIQDVSSGVQTICFVELRGVRFSSKSFQLESVMKQTVLSPKKEMFQTCLTSLADDVPVLSVGVEEVQEDLLENKKEEGSMVILKNRNLVHENMYKHALQKASTAKKVALLAYLEAKRIKKTFMLNLETDENESEGDENIH